VKVKRLTGAKSSINGRADKAASLAKKKKKLFFGENKKMITFALPIAG